MKFAYSVVIAAIMETHTPATFSDFSTCTQFTNQTDYGNAWTACKDSSKLGTDEEYGCCAKFTYIKIDTSLDYDEGIITEVNQPYCMYESERKTYSSNFTDSADNQVYSWHCLLDAETEEASV